MRMELPVGGEEDGQWEDVVVVGVREEDAGGQGERQRQVRLRRVRGRQVRDGGG